MQRSPARREGSPFTGLPFSALVEAAGEPYGESGVDVAYATAAGRDADARPVEEPLVLSGREIRRGQPRPSAEGFRAPANREAPRA